MQQPYTYDLFVDIERDFEVRFQFQNADGTPVDLTGCIAKSQIRQSINNTSPLIVEFTATIVPTYVATVLTMTEVVLSLTLAQTTLLTQSQRYYDLLIKDILGKEQNYIGGKVNIRNVVTEHV